MGMRSARILIPIAAIAALAVASVAPAGGDGPAAGGAAAGEPRAKTPERAELELVETRFGKVVHEAKSGLVAYLFTKDGRGRSRCNGACAKAWPPIKTRRAPIAGKGIREKLLGTSRRKGGAKMVTYRGKPLYFYQHDSPGIVLCHDVTSFGGDWFVVKRNGKRA